MFSLFESLKGLTKLSDISIDNLTFKIHYRLTVLLLIVSSILITCYQYWGKPISCRTEEGEAEQYVLDFCWVSSTFTLPKYIDGKIGKDLVAPGVANHNDEDERKYHTYYQWVCIVLFAQAIFFYLPHFIWKNWEGHKLKYLVQDLQNPVLNFEDKDKQIKFVVRSIDRNFKKQNIYAYKFFLCELFNFINVFWQMKLLNNFLGGEFSNFGLDVWEFLLKDQADRVDPMVKIFPKVTKCNFYHYGISGSIQKTDALCNLPLNNLNEKIFVLLWFWFIIVIVFTIFQLVYHLLTIFSSDFRAKTLVSNRYDQKINNYIRFVLIKSYIGDWFILYMLKNNINEFYFEEIITDLAGYVYERKQNENEGKKHLQKSSQAQRENSLNSQIVKIINERKSQNGSEKSDIESSVSSNLHHMETMNFRNNCSRINNNRSEDEGDYEMVGRRQRLHHI